MLVESAVRYALGRSSYITQSTAEFVRTYWVKLDQKAQQNILRDVNKWLDENRGTGSATHSIDVAIWHNLERDLTGKPR